MMFPACIANRATMTSPNVTRAPERATIAPSRHSRSSSAVLSTLAAMRISCARASSAAWRTALPMWYVEREPSVAIS